MSSLSRLSFSASLRWRCLSKSFAAFVGSDITSFSPGRAFRVLPLVKIFPAGCDVLFFAMSGFRAAGVGRTEVGLGFGREPASLVLSMGSASVDVLLALLAVPW
jgi:hypothetical protein